MQTQQKSHFSCAKIKYKLNNFVYFYNNSLLDRLGENQQLNL